MGRGWKISGRQKCLDFYWWKFEENKSVPARGAGWIYCAVQKEKVCGHVIMVAKFLGEFAALLDCKTVRIFAYSSTREQSNKRSGTRLRLARFAHARLLRHALPISLLIWRKKPTVLQSTALFTNTRSLVPSRPRGFRM